MKKLQVQFDLGLILRQDLHTYILEFQIQLERVLISSTKSSRIHPFGTNYFSAPLMVAREV